MRSVKLFQTLMDKANEVRLANAELIERFPAKETAMGMRRFPPERNTLEKQTEAMYTLAKGVASEFLTPLYPEITVNLLGHDGLTGQKAGELDSHFFYNPFSFDAVVKGLEFSIAMMIANLPADQDEYNALDTWRYLADCMCGSAQTPQFLYLSSKELQCEGCGKTIYYALNLDSLTFCQPYSLKRNEESGQLQRSEPDACPVAESLGPHSVPFAVPSGKIVIANDLRPLFSKEIVNENDSFLREKIGFSGGINSALGRKFNSEYWADHGMMYMQCGNTSPSIFMNAKESIITFKSDYLYDSDADEETTNYTADEERIGYVCTDLWAVTAMDWDHFASLCKSKRISTKKGLEMCRATVHSLPAGEYLAYGYYESDEHAKRDEYAAIVPANIKAV